MVPLTAPFGDDRHVCILEVKMKEGTGHKNNDRLKPPMPFPGSTIHPPAEARAISKNKHWVVLFFWITLKQINIAMGNHHI